LLRLTLEQYSTQEQEGTPLSLPWQLALINMGRVRLHSSLPKDSTHTDSRKQISFSLNTHSKTRRALLARDAGLLPISSYTPRTLTKETGRDCSWPLTCASILFMRMAPLPIYAPRLLRLRPYFLLD